MDSRRIAMYEACKAMGDLHPHSEDAFVHRCLQWLSGALGDVHVEFHEDSGWSVGTCYEDEQWAGWQEGPELWLALARAVLATDPESMRNERED